MTLTVLFKCTPSTPTAAISFFSHLHSLKCERRENDRLYLKGEKMNASGFQAISPLFRCSISVESKKLANFRVEQLLSSCFQPK